MGAIDRAGIGTGGVGIGAGVVGRSDIGGVSITSTADRNG
jgi:hypothetical protein